jgi:[ribosomal protein S18]-alanine N-acetyltransferase
MIEPVLRVLERVDLERLEALERQQAKPWSRDQLAAALEDEAVCVIGAAIEGELVGHAVVARLPFETELQAMLVTPAMRRHGLGSRLLQEVIEQGRRWGSERLLLEVRAGNAAAIGLYRKAGFGEDGRRRGYYPPRPGATDSTREDAILMSRPL